MCVMLRGKKKEVYKAPVIQSENSYQGSSFAYASDF